MARSDSPSGRKFNVGSFFGSVLDEGSASEIQMLDNFQFYYACENSATKKRESSKSHYIAENLLREDGFVNEDRMETMIDVDQVAKEVVPTREILHWRHAVNIGVQTGIFSDNDQWSVESNDMSVADGKLMDRNVKWQSTIKEYCKEMEMDARAPQDALIKPPEVTCSCSTRSVEPRLTNIHTGMDGTKSYPAGMSRLTNDQGRAFGIMDWHLQENLDGKNPEQLLMLMMGSGGVGKSTVIDMVTDLFMLRNCRHKLEKTGMTGIAASNIGGYTLHWWGVLPIYIPSSEEYHKQPS
ncbi:hypothetical protein JB92DRAFT_3112066 [Gautieria morchelliformis]|nr:hypothetical protein JB92DRAFT_3112066 [Gautieria morchelliformis]